MKSSHGRQKLSEGKFLSIIVPKEFDRYTKLSLNHGEKLLHID